MEETEETSEKQLQDEHKPIFHHYLRYKLIMSAWWALSREVTLLVQLQGLT